MQQIELPLRWETLLPVRIPLKVRRAIVTWPVTWQRQVLLTKALAGETIPDWVLKPIDYSFRPVSYWRVKDLRQIVANIKGAERKKMALRLLAEGRLDQAEELILTDTLSDRERTLAGQVHPALMGGEYLPDYSASEVEIARVTLASTCQDVISIRAHPHPGRIGFRVLDEYDSSFTIKPSFAKRPLSLRQLIRLIDTGDGHEMGSIGLGIIQINFDCTEEPAESFADFMDFGSEFYPDLSSHYWFATQRWLAQNRRREAAR
jgi:hypothetical protein